MSTALDSLFIFSLLSFVLVCDYFLFSSALFYFYSFLHFDTLFHTNTYSSVFSHSLQRFAQIQVALELCSKNQELRSMRTELSALQADVVRLREQNSELAQANVQVKSDTSQRLESAREASATLQQQLLEARERVIELEAVVDELRVAQDHQLMASSEKIAMATSEIQRLQNETSGLRSAHAVLKQQMESEHARDLQQRDSDLHQTMRALERTRSKAARQKETRNERIAALEEQLAQAQEHIQSRDEAAVALALQVEQSGTHASKLEERYFTALVLALRLSAAQDPSSTVCLPSSVDLFERVRLLNVPVDEWPRWLVETLH